MATPALREATGHRPLRPPSRASPPSESAGQARFRAARVSLIARLRDALRARHYSGRTERAYVGWVDRFLCGLRDISPDEVSVGHVERFLSRLATHSDVAASTQNQAFSALLFLFRNVLKREIQGLDQVPRAKRPVRVPQVLGRTEVSAILSRLEGTPSLMASIMYGGGLRVLECCRLRIKDIDFARGEITVHEGKGFKDRVTVLPARLSEPLRRHIERVRRQHERDLKEGLGGVALPHALRRKYPGACRQWAWQWIFPAARLHFDPASGERVRHHLHESVVQRAFKLALAAAGVAKAASCHTLRDSFATHLLEDGQDVRTIQELLPPPRSTSGGGYACSPFGEHRTLAADPGC